MGISFFAKQNFEGTQHCVNQNVFHTSFGIKDKANLLFLVFHLPLSVYSTA